MNSPLVVEQARHITLREDFKTATTDEARIRFLYGLVFQRIPTPTEVTQGERFIANWVPQQSSITVSEPVVGQFKKKQRDRVTESEPSVKPLNAWAEYVHALFMTTELSYVN